MPVLSALSIRPGALIEDFDATTTEYTAFVASDVTSATVTATPTEVNSTIRVNGNEVASGDESPAIALVAGVNTIAIEVTPAAGGGVVGNYTIRVTRALSNTTDFVTTWRTTRDNESITIPARGSNNNYNVDWGDGVVDMGLTRSASHEYRRAGSHEVRISSGEGVGTFRQIDFLNNPGANTRKIIAVKQWGNIEWRSMQGAFIGALKSGRAGKRYP